MNELLSGSAERAEYGCTVTFENDAGKRLVVVREGPPLIGLRQACAITLARDETFRIICYSTPGTIYRDLQGGRAQDGNTAATIPELDRAGSAGLRHMLHRRLLEASPIPEKKRRYWEARRAAG